MSAEILTSGQIAQRERMATEQIAYGASETSPIDFGDWSEIGEVRLNWRGFVRALGTSLAIPFLIACGQAETVSPPPSTSPLAETGVPVETTEEVFCQELGGIALCEIDPDKPVWKSETFKLEGAHGLATRDDMESPVCVIEEKDQATYVLTQFKQRRENWPTWLANNDLTNCTDFPTRRVITQESPEFPTPTKTIPTKTPPTKESPALIEFPSPILPLADSIRLPSAEMTFEERMAGFNQYLACLDLEPNLETCASEVNYEIVRPRIQAISDMIARSDISDRSKQFLSNIFSTTFILQEEGKLHWFFLKADIILGFIQPDKRSLFKRDFSASVILPQDLADHRAERIGIAVHEMLHLVKKYEQFQSGSNSLSESEEEHYAQYYESLTARIAEDNGLPGYSKEEALDKMGIDEAEIVYFLDQNGFGPESQLYHYLFSYQKKHQLMHSTRNYEREIEEAETQIAVIEAEWKKDPDLYSHELEMLQKIKNSGWMVGY